MGKPLMHVPRFLKWDTFVVQIEEKDTLSKLEYFFDWLCVGSTQSQNHGELYHTRLEFYFKTSGTIL